MSSQSKNLHFVVLSFLAILFLCPCSTLGINPNGPTAFPLIKRVCIHTKTPDFCVASLGSDPRAAITDLRGLALISLELSLASARENNASITAMLLNKDPIVRQTLQHCLVNYGGTLYALQQQIIDLDNFKYKEAGEFKGIAFENTRDCQRVFVQGRSHFSPLTMRNEKLEKLSDISDVIIGLLPRSIR